MLKTETVRSNKLRKSARGEECTFRLYGICNFDPETTVLCHLDVFGESGTGLKCGDDSAAYGCSACHAVMDGQVKAKEFDALDWWKAAARGITATHRRMRAKGLDV